MPLHRDGRLPVATQDRPVGRFGGAGGPDGSIVRCLANAAGASQGLMAGAGVPVSHVFSFASALFACRRG